MNAKNIPETLSEIEKNMKNIDAELKDKYQESKTKPDFDGDILSDLANLYAQEFAQYQKYKAALKWGENISMDAFDQNDPQSIVRNFLWRKQVEALHREYLWHQRRKRQRKELDRYEVIKDYSIRMNLIYQITPEYEQALFKFRAGLHSPSDYIPNHELKNLSVDNLDQLRQAYSKLSETSKRIVKIIEDWREKYNEEQLIELIKDHFDTIAQYTNLSASLGLSAPVLRKDIELQTRF